jgi:hypothetical protein
MIPLGIAGGAVALSAAGWIALRGDPEAEPGRMPAAQRSSPTPEAKRVEQPSKDTRSLPAAEQLKLAFAAAFGSEGSATRTIGDETYTYTPAALEWIGEKAALLSFGRNAQDCHACFGTIGIHYLKPIGDRFEVTGAWPTEIHGVAWGAPTNGLSVSHKFSSHPVVMSEYGDMNQGCAYGGVLLTELRPEGPSHWGSVRTVYVNPVGDDQATEISGKIVGIRKNRSFKVVYTGNDRFIETYVRRGSKFVLAAKETRMPVC